MGDATVVESLPETGATTSHYGSSVLLQGKVIQSIAIVSHHLKTSCTEFQTVSCTKQKRQNFWPAVHT